MKFFFQKYWSIFLVILTSTLAILFFKKNNDLSSKINFLNEKHKEELDKIEKARSIERFQKEQNEKKYRHLMETIKNKYAEEKQELEKKKEKQVSEIIKLHGNDPQELAFLLSKTTGFKIILPED